MAAVAVPCQELNIEHILRTGLGGLCRPRRLWRFGFASGARYGRAFCQPAYESPMRGQCTVSVIFLLVALRLLRRKVRIPGRASAGPPRLAGHVQIHDDSEDGRWTSDHGTP